MKYYYLVFAVFLGVTSSLICQGNLIDYPFSPVTVVKTMPIFPGCDNALEAHTCSDSSLVAFMYGHLKWPTSIKEICASGTIVGQFTLGRDGLVSNPKVIRTIHPAWSEELMRVMNIMIDRKLRWIPGKDAAGDPVAVLFNFPIRIHLE